MKDKELINYNVSILLFNVYIISTFFSLVFSSSIINLIMYSTGIGLFVIVSLNIKKQHLHLYAILSLLILIFALNILLFSSTLDGIAHVIKVFPAIGGTIFLLKGHLSKRNSIILFSVPVFYFLVNILLGIDPNLVFHSASRNMISVVMIFFMSLFYIAYYQKNKVYLFPAMILAMISIWATGRTGIFVSILILLGVFALKFSKGKVSKFIYLIMISIILFLLFQGDTSSYKFLYDYRFDVNTLKEDPRFDIWSSFFENTSFINVLLGNDWRNNTIYFQGSGNVHNSYINAVIRFGISAIIIFFFLLRGLIIAFRRNKLFFILISSILIRSLSDSIILFGMYDCILFYMVSQVIIESKTRKVKNV